MIYFIRNEKRNAVKIGYCRSRKELGGRLIQLQVGNDQELSVLATVDSLGREAEIVLLNKFLSKHIRGEWFLLDELILDYIEKNTKQKQIRDFDSDELKSMLASLGVSKPKIMKIIKLLKEGVETWEDLSILVEIGTNTAYFIFDYYGWV